MKPAWLVAVVLAGACSSEHDSGRTPAPSSRAESRRSIDLPAAGEHVAIRGVELVPGAAPGVLELGYRIETTDPALQVPAQIMCRVGGYNVVYPSGGDGKHAGPRLASLFRPDPFAEPVEGCEVTFYAHDRPIAAACYRGGELAAGACPAGTFPRPRLQTDFAVDLSRAALELRHGAALVSGLFTLAQPLGEGRRFATQIRCEDQAGVASGEGELAFTPLEKIPVGASVYGPVAMFLDRTPQPTATCDLRVVSRATSGAPTEQIHARYCLTTGAVRAGDCPETQ